MPNRIIKESVCTSESIDQLTPFEETFYYRLWVHCDDFGRMDARPKILKAKLFPLKDRLPMKDIESALARLAVVGCVVPYESGGKPFLYIPSWQEHQRVRNSKEKYPPPDNDNSRQVAASCGESLLHARVYENPIQSESNPNMSHVSDGDAEDESQEKPKGKTFAPDSDAYKASRYLDRRICENIPSKKPADESTLQSWAADIEKVHRLDGQSWDDIADILEFCQSDSFWYRNILSGAKFRKQFIQLLAKARGRNAG